MIRSLRKAGNCFQTTSRVDREKLPYWAILGFIVLSLMGVILRYMQIFPLPGFNYMFLLHAHSHFAFAGWTFFALAFLIDGAASGNYSPSCRKLYIVTLIVSYGMLITFTLQGYKIPSIVFSTLFILVTYWYTYLLYRQRKKEWRLNAVATSLVFGALFFLCLSSLGPFALGPIMSKGLRGTALYQNAIYYYLHFQMNGWMILAALGLMANSYLVLPRVLNRSIKCWLFLFIISNILLFALFTLWSQPPNWVWLFAFAGSILQLISWIVLCIHFSSRHSKLSLLVYVALLAISVKSIMQVLICIPSVAEWTFLNRNLIIGYVHLITLGCVTPLILDQFIRSNYFNVSGALKRLNVVYIGWTILYLILLFLQPLLSTFTVSIPYFQQILLIVSLGFLLVGVGFLRSGSSSSSSSGSKQ